MAKIRRVFVLALFLATWGFTLSNVNTANAQSGTTPYDYGFAVGGALGVRDGSQKGIDDDIAGLAFNPMPFEPAPEYVCSIYQDVYEVVGCVGSVQYPDFANGYSQAYRSGYYYGYVAGFYLNSDSLGSLCC
jgi:hypothetical protein